MPTRTLLPTSPASTADAVVNLLHLKLFHHFQTCTRQTLLLAPEVWLRALQLCFQFEFLMNAVLCVAARHLATLQPEDATYPTAAASHLCAALSRFRHELSDNFIAIHIDAFTATSLLLQYEVWTNTDFFTHQDNGAVLFDPSRERIFEFNSSLKQVFLKCVPLIWDRHSVVMPHLQHNPADTLVGTAQISDATLAHYQDFFSHHHPLDLELLNIPLPFTRGADPAISTNQWQQLHNFPKTQDAPDPIGDAYAPVITRICLIQFFLPEAQPPDSASSSVESPLFPDLARYILSFRVMCYGPFASMVQQSDPHALLLLYHFYRAVRILLPPRECWWAHKRARMSEMALKEWLTRESAK